MTGAQVSVNSEPLLDMPARAMAKAIADGSISSTDIVSASLRRCREVDQQLNAFCQIFDDEAMERAAAADRKVAAGHPIGPLHGIPFAVKDLTPTKGHPTTCGSWALGDWIPDHTALCIERLVEAGAIIVGKTTTPEFAFSAFTRSPRWGVTRNPWDSTRTSGGSSGGSGVAVATGCVPFAEGTDMGGSIRIPASCCGVVGLKPSLGRIPMTILPSVFDNISHFGPIARSVDDAVLFMETASGASDEDILSMTQPFSMKSASRSPLKRQRFAYSLDQGYYNVDPEVSRCIEEALDRIRQTGADVEQVDLKWSRSINDQWYDYWCVYMAAFYGHLLEEFSDRMDANVVTGIRHGYSLSGVQFKSIELLRTRIWNDMAAVFKDFDYFLTPTCAIPAPSADQDDTDYIATLPDGLYGGFEMTCVFNFLSACPVLSLPVGSTASGLPIGMQIVGKRHRDEDLLVTAERVERILGDSGLWRGKTNTVAKQTTAKSVPSGTE